MKLALTEQQKKQLNHKISVEIYSIILISTRIQFELTAIKLSLHSQSHGMEKQNREVVAPKLLFVIQIGTDFTRVILALFNAGDILINVMVSLGFLEIQC